jgi:hypothetical protein
MIVQLAIDSRPDEARISSLCTIYIDSLIWQFIILLYLVGLTLVQVRWSRLVGIIYEALIKPGSNQSTGQVLTRKFKVTHTSREHPALYHTLLHLSGIFFAFQE